MSRLRRAVKKYQEADDEEPVLLDSSVQDDVILELRASLSQSNRPSKVFINAVILFVVVLNLSLLTIPVYKTGKNAVASPMTIICSLLHYLVLKHDRFQQSIPFGISRNALLAGSAVLSGVILILKWATGFHVRDMVYAVPALNCVGLLLLTSNQETLEKEIRSLEKLKYNYKEA